METWMWLLAAAVVLLPFVLMAAFNRRNTADSRGQRVNRSWRT